MKIIAILFLMLFVTASSAFELECKDIHTTLTTQKGKSPYVTEGSIGKQTTTIKLVSHEQDVYVIGSEKVKLEYLSEGMGTVYLYERTISGNINLYSLFKDGTLTISKSYDVLGMSKMNVQTIYQCVDKE
jgi:hypothetical protein